MEYFINTNEKHLIFLDTEFDQDNLVQLSFIILDRVSENRYALSSSFNIYIKQNLSGFFCSHHIIGQVALNEEGIDIDLAEDLFLEAISNYDFKECLFIGHGIKQDISIIEDSFYIDFTGCNFYCTYEHAKTLELPCLKLRDLAIMNGYYPSLEHCAFDDCKTTIAAFAYLKERENERY